MHGFAFLAAQKLRFIGGKLSLTQLHRLGIKALPWSRTDVGTNALRLSRP